MPISNLSATVIALLAVTAFASPAAAQDLPDAAKDSDAFSGDYLIVGMGVALVPSYEGSDEHAIIGAGGVTGRVAGIGIGARSGGISLDFVPDGEDSRIGWGLGPVARWGGNRTAHIKDPVVEALGKLKGSIETGVAGSVAIKRLITPVDALTFSADVRWDISGHGGGQVVSTSVSYFSPVSQAAAVGLSVAADIVDTQYANHQFGVTAAGSTASGLPLYTARGGLKNVGLRAFAAYDLNGNLRDGGLAVVGGMGLSWLKGSAAESPLTSLRGKSSQWLAGAGLAYTF